MSPPLWGVNGLGCANLFYPLQKPFRAVLELLPSPGGSEVVPELTVPLGTPILGTRQTGPFCRSKATCVSSLCLGLCSGLRYWTRIRGSASALSFCPSLCAEDGGRDRAELPSPAHCALPAPRWSTGQHLYPSLTATSAGQGAAPGRSAAVPGALPVRGSGGRAGAGRWRQGRGRAPV